jgi:hypothetical protein
MILKIINHLEFLPFLVGLSLGIFIVCILKPAPLVITKYPNLENIDHMTYRDRNSACFKYEAKTVDCDKSEDRIKPYPLQ